MTNREDGTEEQLGEAVRRSVSRHADALETRPDESDLFVRIGHRGARTQRVLAIAAVLMLAAGALGGYLVGNSGGEDDLAIVTPRDGGSSGSAIPSGSLSGIIGGRMTHVFTREANGITIRVYALVSDSPVPEPVPSNVMAEMSNDAAVGFGGLFVCGDSPLARAGGIFGVGEGSPSGWVMVRVQGVAAGATLVRADFGTSHDEMKPVDGIAALASPVDAGSTGGLEGTLEAVDAHGTVLATLGLDTVAQPPECSSGAVLETPTTAPNTLPPASGPPPADEDAARDSVMQAFVDFSSTSNPRDVRLAAIEDADVIGPLLDQSHEVGFRSYGSAIDNMTITVSDIRFLDETHAAAITTLHIPGNGDVYPNRVETAVFVDGRWKLTRQTICDRLEPSGVRCPPA